jgi:hypothetical protein
MSDEGKFDITAIPIAKAERQGSPFENTTDAQSFSLALIEYAESIFAEDGEVAPTAFFLTGDTVMVMGLTFGNEEEKDIMAQLMGTVANEIGADAIGFISETWMASGETKEEALALPPSQRPDRKEAIVATASWKEDDEDLKHSMKLSFIHRDGDSVSLLRDDTYDHDDGSMSGRFFFG